MKNYVGVRIVKAEPEEKDGRKGYRVVYPDGKTAWVPKETFESQYKEVISDN